MSFWGELKRRNVFKVGAAYVIVAWLIVQVANTFFPLFHMPGWTVTLVASLLVLGLPITLIIAWAFELTPDGVKRSEHVPLDESITHVTGRKLNYIVTGLLVLAVAYILFDNYYLDRHVVQTEAPKTIAVLPFDDLSPEKDQEYFVLGLSEEILNYLSKISGLHVTSKTSSFTFKDSDKTIQEIAGTLGVAHILEGSVRKAGDALRITAQLISVADDRHIWSETYNRELKDIFAVQEDIAKTVANELKLNLGIDNSLKQQGGTENLEAYEQYLIAQGNMGEGDYDAYKNGLIPINKAIEMDPKFALAWATKAWIHVFLTISGPGKQSASEKEAALGAAQKAIDLEPNLAAGYYSLGFAKLSKGDWIQAGLSFNKAIDLQTEPLWSEGILQAAIHYMAVANFQKAYGLHDKLRQIDPLHQIGRANYMFNLGVLGDIRRVEEEYERCKELFGGHWNFGDSYIRMLRLGTTAIVSRNVRNSGVRSWDPIGDQVSQYIGAPEKGLAKLNQLYAENNGLSSGEFIFMSVWAAYFGDPEFAIEAMEKGGSLEASGLCWVWIPIMQEVRQIPQFKEFIRGIGLVDYWDQFGWPEICQPTDNGDFVCD